MSFTYDKETMTKGQALACPFVIKWEK